MAGSQVSPLRLIFIAGNAENNNAPELNCHDHPDWYADADAENLATCLDRAIEHLREDHRSHVANCSCASRVTDLRCLPGIRFEEFRS
jgi:hypothetical protein